MGGRRTQAHPEGADHPGDARELVGLLGTADEIDPRIDDRVFRTRSSEELPGITLIAEWAKGSGLVQ